MRRLPEAVRRPRLVLRAQARHLVPGRRWRLLQRAPGRRPAAALAPALLHQLPLSVQLR